ncbi:hypothetical protein HK102_014077 [Quaeritorhiza haematococci]|nr:hypothetical protein HK102_014077 [Quaeritorhiza haematococci]
MKLVTSTIISALLFGAGTAMAQGTGPNIAQLQQLMVDPQFNDIVRGCNGIAAAWIRAAFHDAGVISGSAGGADGSIQFEGNARQNFGLGETIAFFRSTKARFPDVSFADIVAWGGITSIKACGGPDIPFSGGRVDATGAQNVDALPGDPSIPIPTLKQSFQRLGLSVQDFVALSAGGHSVGGVRFRPDGFDGTPNQFDNAIFSRILANNTEFASDRGLAQDPETKPIVERFANDQNAFFRAFNEAYVKMMQIGPNARNLVLVSAPSTGSAAASSRPAAASASPAPQPQRSTRQNGRPTA